MLRMEIALFLAMAFVAYIYFTAAKQHNLLHRIFSVLLVVMLGHLVLDTATLYAVCHLDKISLWLMGALHRPFIGTMVLLGWVLFCALGGSGFLAYIVAAIIIPRNRKPTDCRHVAREYPQGIRREELV